MTNMTACILELREENGMFKISKYLPVSKI